MKRAEGPSIILIQDYETQVEKIKDGNGTRRGRKSRDPTRGGEEISVRKRTKGRRIRRGKVH
jgi:hypothetical protein